VRSCASIAVVEASGCLVVIVTDDGHGGARLAEGGGLAGLRDRLAAVGGSLELASAPGGTTLTMRVAAAMSAARVALALVGFAVWGTTAFALLSSAR
jgi:glucose-6-phosphate-specific signal transduction histidine kinase